jgi:adiponectin receptor
MLDSFLNLKEHHEKPFQSVGHHNDPKRVNVFTDVAHSGPAPADLLPFERDMEQPWTLRPMKRIYRLVSFDEAPPWMQDNPFIRTGYRLRYTARMCLTSLFHHHNETGNVWTHFLGLLLFLVMAGFVYARVLEPYWSHWIVFTIFMGACSMCMLCSAIYHLFNCHYNEVIAMRMLKMDLLGIAVLIVASFVPLLYFGFACLPTWRLVYLVMIGILGGAGFIAPFIQMREEYAIYRTLLYVAITCSGLFPAGHILFGFPMGGTIAAPMLGVALMFLLYGAGLLFYLLRIPERWYPGHFDYWLNSHQIWHMFVLGAAVCHFFACVAMYQRYQHMGGDIC